MIKREPVNKIILFGAASLTMFAYRNNRKRNCSSSYFSRIKGYFSLFSSKSSTSWSKRYTLVLDCSTSTNCQIVQRTCRIIPELPSLTPAYPLSTWRIYSFVKDLFWKTNIGNSEGGFNIRDRVVENSSFTNIQKTFDYILGFRCVVNSISQRVNWNTNIFSTGLYNKNIQKIPPNTTIQMYLLHEDRLDFAFAIHSWKFPFNVTNRDIGNAFFVSRMFALRPYLGLKEATINQKIWGILFSNSIYYLKCQFYGSSPSIGIDNRWIFSPQLDFSLSLFSELWSAFIFGNIKNSWLNYPKGVTETKSMTAGLKQKTTHLMIRFFMDFRWNTFLNKGLSYLVMKLGNEFRQNQFLHRSFIDNSESPKKPYLRLSNDLIFYESTLNLRWSF